MRISDWSSDVCSSDLAGGLGADTLYGGMRGYSEGDGLEDAAFGAGAGLFGNLGGQYAVAPLVRAAGNTSVGRSVTDLLANDGTGAGNAVRGVRGQAPIPSEGSRVPRPSVGQRALAGKQPQDVE